MKVDNNILQVNNADQEKCIFHAIKYLQMYISESSSALIHRNLYFFVSTDPPQHTIHLVQLKRQLQGTLPNFTEVRTICKILPGATM